MKNYLLSFLYCLLYLAITLVGFWGLSCVLDAPTYKTVLTTVLFLTFGMSFFLCIWFKQDELFFLLFLSFFTYISLNLSNLPQLSQSSYYDLIAFPLICLLYPVNVYFLFQIKTSDSFLYSFLKRFLIVLCEVALIYVATYFLPILFGSAFLLAFELHLSNILRYSFGLFSSSVPLVSIFVFTACLFLLINKRFSKIEQIQACAAALMTISFISFFFNTHPAILHLCFVSGTSCTLFSLLQISHKMAFLDELTNIPGRRALMNSLKEVDGEDYTLAMIDIDHFKRLNDSYGHEVGDLALRTIASTLSQHIANGTLYRYGGEEFVLLYPKKSIDDILDEMENTRTLVSNSDFFLHPKQADKKQASQPYMASVHITLSIGVTQKQPLQSYDEVINIADQALYKAKQTGRNKTVYNKGGKFFELFRVDIR